MQCTSKSILLFFTLYFVDFFLTNFECSKILNMVLIGLMITNTTGFWQNYGPEI